MTGAPFLMARDPVLESEDLLHYGLLPNLPKVICHDTLQIKYAVFNPLSTFTPTLTRVRVKFTKENQAFAPREEADGVRWFFKLGPVIKTPLIRSFCK